MTLHKRPESAVWQYEFMIAGKRHRGSTKTTDKQQAAVFEAAQRLSVVEASKRLIDEAATAAQSMSILEVAHSWLEWSKKNLADHAGNLSRARKLFGREMKLIGGKWDEVPSGRYGLQHTIKVCEITPPLLENLRSARAREGNSPGTIGREMALVQSMLAHVGVRMQYNPTRSARLRINKVLALPAPPESVASTGCGFSTSQYEALAPLRQRLEKSLRTTVSMRIAVGEPYRVSGGDGPGAGAASEPDDLMRDQHLRATLWADAPRPVVGSRWPLLSFRADAPDLDALLEGAWTEASYVWEALTGSGPAARSATDNETQKPLTIGGGTSRVVLMLQARAARRLELRQRR